MTEEQAVFKIAAYCSQAERSKYDVKKKLTAWKIEEDIIERIVSKMEKENFIDEKRFCRAFIKDKARFNKWGKNKIVYELKRKEIPSGIINASFENVEEECGFEDQLIKILTAKNSVIKAGNMMQRKAKLFRFAAGKGFSADMINKCLDNLLKRTDDEDFF